MVVVVVVLCLLYYIPLIRTSVTALACQKVLTSCTQFFFLFVLYIRMYVCMFVFFLSAFLSLSSLSMCVCLVVILYSLYIILYFIDTEALCLLTKYWSLYVCACENELCMWWSFHSNNKEMSRTREWELPLPASTFSKKYRNIPSTIIAKENYSYKNNMCQLNCCFIKLNRNSSSLAKMRSFNYFDGLISVLFSHSYD